MIDLIPAHLRTTNVTGLLANMEATGDYSPWPLLRDALMDAGAQDADLAPVYRLAIQLEPENDEWRLEWARCVGGERGRLVQLGIELQHRGYDTSRPELILLANGGKWSDWPIVGYCQNLPTHRHIAPIGSPHFTFRRGFVESITCSWSDWLTHSPRLFWHPAQTVECPECRGTTYRDANRANFRCRDCTDGRVPRPLVEEVECPNKPWKQPGLSGPTCFTNKCKTCSGRGRMSQCVLSTCQPITEVTLTTHPLARPDQGRRVHETIASRSEYFVVDGDGRFDRVKCPTCDGGPSGNRFGAMMIRASCHACRGEPLNSWSCEAWPGIRFKMPQGDR